MSWNDLTLNPRVLLGYYSEPPALDPIEIHAITLDRDGPTLEMVVELTTFPDWPSPRWDRSANAVQVRLRFIDLRELNLQGWGTRNVGDLRIASVAGGIRFEFRSDVASCVGLSGWFEVAGVSGYTKDKS